MLYQTKIILNCKRKREKERETAKKERKRIIIVLQKFSTNFDALF